MPQYIVLPNGSYFEVAEGETPQQAALVAQQKYPEAFRRGTAGPKEDTTGFKAAAAAGVEQMKGEAALTAAKMGLLDPVEAERIYKAQEEKAKKRFTPTEEGWLEAPWQKLKETAGGSLPYMVAPAVAGGIGALAATGVGAPVAAGIVGAGAAGLAGVGQYTGSNIARQMEQGKTLEEASGAAALGAAIPQAALDVVSLRMIPGLGRIFGAAGKEVTEETAKAIAQQTLKQAAVDYAKATGKTMGVEGLTEVGQQALERLQAGLSITDPQAREEYFDSFIGGAALAGALGPVGRAAERSQIKREGQRLETERLQEEGRIAREAQAEQEAQRKLAEAQQAMGTLFPETAPEGPAAPPGVTADPAERLAQVEDALAQKVASVRSGTPLSEEDRAELSQLQKERNALAAQVEETAPPAEAPTEANRRIMLLEQAIEAQQEQMQGATPEQTLVLQPRIQKLRDALAAAKEEAGVPSKSASELQMQTLPLYKQAKAIETRMRNAQEQGDEVVAAKQAQKLLDIRQQIADIEAPRRKAKEFEAAQEARTAPVQEGLFSPENIAAEQGRRDVREAEIQTELQQQQADIEAQQRAPEADIGADLFARMGEAEEAAAEAKDVAESKRLYEQMSTARDQREMFPSPEEGIAPITRMMPTMPEATGAAKAALAREKGEVPAVPKQLQVLLDRAKAAPNVDDATRALIDRVDAELPALQKAMPVATPAGTKPVEYVSPTGKAVAAPAAARRAPLMDVAAFLSRVVQGRDASAEAAQVQNHLARLEEGKRSETEQRTQYAQRALTAEEKQAVQGTALAGREGVMTRAPSGEIARGVQTEMPFEEGKSPAARERAVAFESFEEFDKFLAGDALQILRNAMKLSGETASRLIQALGPKMQELAQLRAKLLPLVERQRALRAAAAQEKQAGRDLLKETDAEVTRLYLEAHMVIADLYAKRDAAVQAVADAQAQSAQLTAQIQENATALQAKIAQQPSLDATVRAKEQAMEKALEEITKATRRLQQLEETSTAHVREFVGKDWSETSFAYVRYQNLYKETKAVRKALHKASVAYSSAHNALMNLQTDVAQRAYATPPALTKFVEESAALDDKLRGELASIGRRIGGLTTARNRAVDTLATVQAQVRDIPEFKEALDNALQERATAEQLKLEADADAAKTEAQAEALNSEADALRNAVTTLARDVEAAQRSIPARARREAAARMPQETQADREARDAEKRRAEQKRLETLAEHVEEGKTVPGVRVTFEKPSEESLFPAEYIAAVERMYDTTLTNEDRMAAAKEADAYLEKLRASQEKTRATQAKALQLLTERRAEKIALIKDLKENKPGRVAELAREQKILENTEARLAALRRATKTPVGTSRTVPPAREGEIEGIAATQRQRRATSPVTREVSSAPGQFRTGTEESRAGETRTPTYKPATESTKVTERNVAVGKKAQQAANVEAERMRKEAEETAKIVEGVSDMPLDEAIGRLEEVVKSGETLVQQARDRANEFGISETEASKRDKIKVEANIALNNVKSRLDALRAQKLAETAAAEQKAATPEKKRKDVAKAKEKAAKIVKTVEAPEAEADKIAILELPKDPKTQDARLAIGSGRPDSDFYELGGFAPDESAAFHKMNFADAARFGASKARGQRKELFTRLAELFDSAPTEEKKGLIFATDGSPRKPSGAIGAFNTATNVIFTPSEKGKDYLGVLLHELTHAATWYALRVDSNLAERVDGLRKKAQEWLETREGKAYVRRNSLGLLRKSAAGKKGIYGLKNVDEFLSELYSNRAFQKFLAEIPSDAPKKSLLTRFVEFMSSFFTSADKAQQSLFAEAVALSEEVLDITRSEIYGTERPLTSIRRRRPVVEAVETVTEDEDADFAFAVADTMDGVFPNVKPVSMPGIPADISSIVSRTVGRNATIGDKLAAFTSGLRWRTAIADRWAPAEALLKRGVAQGSIDEVRALQSRIHMRLHEQTTQYIETAAINGVPQLVKQPDGTYLVEGKAGANLRQMAEALSKANIGNEQYTEQVFTTWLAILRAEKDGVGYDKLNFKKPITASEAKALKDFVANNAAAKNAFEEARTLYKEYNRNLLNLLVDASVMSREKADELLKGDYVPYYRERNGVVELVVGNSKPVQIGNVIDQPYLKELVGGQEQILPFFSGAMQNTSMLVRMALRNLQTKDMAYLLEDLGLLVKRGKAADKQIAIHKGDGPAGMRVIHFKYKGENYWAELNPDVFPKDIPADLMISGMQGIKTAIPWLVKIMGMPANLLRKTVTRMPLYALRQTIRDPLHAWMTTGGDFTPIISSYKELGKMVAGKSDTEEMLKRSAVISSNVYTGDPQDASRILRDIMTGKNWWNASMEKLDNFALQGDAATRAVLYNTYREKGMSHAQALLGTLESMNFSRRGTSASMHWLSTMIPFFNAQIQGLDAVYRAAKGDTVFENKMDARAKLIRRGALVTAATVAYALMMEDDEAYKNATPEERAMNWFVRVPGLEEAVRVPIPFELGLAFKTVPELMINAAFGDTTAKEAAKALGKQLWMSSPLSLPTALKAPVELAANYSFYSDQPIESSRERNLTVDQRYRQNTTELAKILGKVGIVSPIQIEHFVRSYTGGAGVLLMSLANPVLRPLSAEADVEKPERKLSEMPVFGGLFQPNTGRGLVNAAFDDVERYQQAARTYKELATRNPNEARTYAERYAREIALASTGGAFRQQMGEFAKLKRQIVSSKLPPEEKSARIERIKQQEIKLAQKLREMANA